MKIGERLAGVECPECGSIRTGVFSAGFDSAGTRLRIRKCKDCDFKFTTLELPIEYDFRAADTANSNRRVRAARRSTDYFLVSHGQHRTNAVHAKLVKGRSSDYCYSGRHSMVGDNVYYKPNGKRNCRECMREQSKNYMILNRDQINAQRVVLKARKRKERINDPRIATTPNSNAELNSA